MLTVGDHEEVLRRSRCLILDPLAHHPSELRSILRPETRETIKELAQLLPELWLLRRFIPHLHNPHLTERRDENIVVFGEQTTPTPHDDNGPD